MNVAIHWKGDPVSAEEEPLFKFQDLEITWNTLVIRFFEEKTVIPLKQIASYRLSWYLHDQSRGGRTEKYWFLILTVNLKNGGRESRPIVVAKDNHVDDESQLREDIEGNVAKAIEFALSWHGGLPQKLDHFERDEADFASIAGLN